MPPSPEPAIAADAPVSSARQLIAKGWGYASINTTSIQADNGAGLTRGIIGLANKGQARKPDDWGSLRAWAWGASRGLDYLLTDAAFDAKHVGGRQAGSSYWSSSHVERAGRARGESGVRPVAGWRFPLNEASGPSANSRAGLR